MGSIRKLGDDTFELRWEMPRDPATGLRRTKSKRFKGGIRLAQKELARIVSEIDDEASRASDTSFESVAKDWLELKRSGLKLRTHAEYERLLRVTILPTLGAKPISKISPRDLDRFYQSLYAENPKRDITHVHAVIRNVFAQCLKWGYVTANPALMATVPKYTPMKTQIASVDRLGAILEEASENEMWVRLFAFAALTGMRRGEICALRWTDIHDETLVVARSLSKIGGQEAEGPTKTHQVRKIYLDASAQKLLLAQFDYYIRSAKKAGVEPSSDGYIWFGFPTGLVSLYPDSLSSAFKRYAVRAGAPELHFHSLRHFSATQLIAAGVDIRTVATRLGHADPSITLRVYAHALEQKDKEAAGILGGLVKKFE